MKSKLKDLARAAGCCDFGEFKCTAPTAIGGRRHDVDICIADIVAALNAAHIPTKASCCGHKKRPGSILLVDGREIQIKENQDDV